MHVNARACHMIHTPRIQTDTHTCNNQHLHFSSRKRWYVQKKVKELESDRDISGHDEERIEREREGESVRERESQRVNHM